MAQEDVIKTNVSPRRMSAPKRAYLVAYNAISALLWSVVLGRTVATLAANGLETGPALVYPAVGEFTKWTQTLAALEIVHSVLGMRPCPPFLPPPPHRPVTTSHKLHPWKEREQGADVPYLS